MVAGDDPVFAMSDEGKRFFERFFEYASEIAVLINVMPSMPWITACKQRRSNAEANTLFDHYCVNMCLPFFDHIINGIDVCFDKYDEIVLAMAGLVPYVIAEDDVSVIDILDMYSDDLPSPVYFNHEVVRWKRKWTASEVSAWQDTIAKALKNIVWYSIYSYQSWQEYRCYSSVTSIFKKTTCFTIY